jgi:hypothetical protein
MDCIGEACTALDSATDAVGCWLMFICYASDA